MATKTINLKMVIDRSDKPKAKELRQALWTTHEEINKAVAQIEKTLLLFRGKSYLTKDDNNEEITISATEVQTEALQLARNIQNNNNNSILGNDDEILQSLQQLYLEIIKGDSQESNKFASPLMDKESMGLMQIFDQIADPEPEWVDLFKNTDQSFIDKSKAWIKTEQANILINGKEDTKLRGRKAGWINKLSKGEQWQEAFIKDQENKKKDIKGSPELIRKLKQQLFLLPLFKPPVLSKFRNYKDKELSPWDRLALRLAVAHILSWESWNVKCKEEWEKINKLISEQKKCIDKIDAIIIESIRQYERNRHEKLKTISQLTNDEFFKINSRMLRGFDRVKQEWSKKNCLTENERKEILAEIQTELRWKFGDPDLYLWLAYETNINIWKSDSNPLYEVAKLNGLEKMLKRRRPQALMTFADARKHPRWSQFEKKGGTNLKNYEIIQKDNYLFVKLPLLVRTENALEEKTFEIKLAKSGQINNPEIKIINGEQKLLFFYSNEQYSASFSGSDILFDRSIMENKSLEKIQDGQWGKNSNSFGVWFKLVIDIDPLAPEGWLDKKNRPKSTSELNHFKSSLLNEKHIKEIEHGLRVLTVDLGIRTFASCSVFELVKGVPQKGLFWCADTAKDLWAKHERSFVINLPGDNVSPKIQKERIKAYEELSRHKQNKNFLRNILQLSIIDKPDERKKAIDSLASIEENISSNKTCFSIFKENKHILEELHNKPDTVWKAQVEDIFKKCERVVSDDISDWRKKTRPKLKERPYDIGKSYWGIEYLENVRKILRGWSTHARIYNEINRRNTEKQGIFANHLLNHINNKKEDRIKTGADLIIQSARGRIYDKTINSWKPKFPPCRLVLFEDLAKYRFHTDRPRRENSQLMRWSHRSIYNEVNQQAAIYGIHIDTTGAGFSSKFFAKNGCPGIRATKITNDFLQYLNNNETIKNKLLSKGFTENIFQENNIIPWEGGEFFISFGEDNKLQITHADINAAQNLQRRFWTRYCDTFRVKVKNIITNDGEELWINEDCGSRVLGGLSKITGGDGFTFFRANGNGFVSEKLGKRSWSKITGFNNKETEVNSLDAIDEELIDIGYNPEMEEQDQRKIFFRDFSGNILDKDKFYPSEIFWHNVNKKIAEALKEKYEPTPF